MAKVVTDNQHYGDIADAIRGKNGEETQYKPSEMAAAITNIPSGGADFSEVESKLSNGFTDYEQYFYYKQAMTEAPAEILQHTGNATKFNSMFSGCSALTSVPLFDTSRATNFTYMFRDCSALTSVPQFDTSSGTNFNDMFTGCSALTSVPQFDTSSGTNFAAVFSECTALVTVGGIDFSKNGSTKLDNAFYNCTSLENITINGVIKKTGLNFGSCSKLTHDSLMSIINALYDWAAEGSTSTYTLTLGSTNLAKLTDEEKAIATEKGWTLA